MNKDCSATPSTGALRRRIPHPWRRLHRRTCTTPEPVPVYGFELVSALLHGWQLHVVRQRLIHEQSARSNQHWHYWLGSLAALFTAAAGSSAAVAWEKQTSNASLAFVSALLAALASVFAGIVTFLDLEVAPSGIARLPPITSGPCVSSRQPLRPRACEWLTCRMIRISKSQGLSTR